MDAERAGDALAALLRWEASGADWVLRELDAGRAIVDLLTCDGGEVTGRLASAEPGFVRYVLIGPGGDG
nr:hypothetical protein [Propionicimonas sp.]